MTGPHAQPAAATVDGLTLTEAEIVAAIADIKRRRDELPPFDARRYDLQYEIYQRNQDLIFLQRARRNR